VNTPFLVDCDPGVDDALALLYLATVPEFDLRAVTTVSGNVTAGQAAINALKLLDLVGARDVPVAIGATETISGPPISLAPSVHGSDGLGNVSLPEPTAGPVAAHAVDLLIEQARKADGELRILAIGPLSNLALALRAEPRLPSLVHSLTIMGGAVLAPGNVTAVAEANIHNDPEAAAEVLAADWPITVVPLDATMTELLTEDMRQRLLASDLPTARFAGEVVDYYFNFYLDETLTTRAAPCHDPLAAAIAVGLVQPVLAPLLHTTVETGSGPARGELIADTRGKYRGFPDQEGAHTRVVLETDHTFAEHLVSRLLRP
jgi:purine nucleosidase